MNLDTNSYRFISSKLNSLQSDLLVALPANCRYRHQTIQSKLSLLANYFSQTATIYEQNENSQSGFNFKKGKLKTSTSTDVNLLSLVTKQDKKMSVYGSIRYSIAQAKKTYASDYVSSSLSVNLGDFKATGEAELALWKNQKFDPRVNIDLDADVALASVNLYSKIGTNKVYGTLNARGAVGALYADATCILNKNEQTFEAGAGVCALRGEASISFNVFGAKITLTGTGSIGSAEANVSYHHKNREWEFGSKLGFIAGLGFKVKVNY